MGEWKRLRWLGALGLLWCVSLPVAAPEANTLGVARGLHRSQIVVDLHADTLYQQMRRWRSISRWQRRLDVDVPKLRRGGVGAQVFVLYVSPRFCRKRGACWRYLKRMHKGFHRLLRESKGALVHARSAADVRRIRKRGKIAALLAIEGLHPLEGQWSRALELVKWGLLYAGLTWNNSNPFATSARDALRSSKYRRRGLTKLGRRLLPLLEKHRVLVDLSHASKKTFWDVQKLAKRPFIASHSNAQRLCKHYRNLDDAQLRAIARHGGVVGINFYTLFLKDGRRHRGAGLATVMAHIDHVVRVAGIHHVALGSDFDGILSKPRGLRHVGDLPRLTRALLRRGYAKRALGLFLGGNVLRLMEPKAKPLRTLQEPASPKKRPGQVKLRRKSAPARARFRGKAQSMAATAHPLATAAALGALKRGGTAADAAVAAAFVLGVVEPYASGLGGGGLLLYYDASKRQIQSLDFRERAPLLAHARIFSRHGWSGRWRSREGHLAVATPGMVAGMDALWRRYGSLSWASLLKPAARAAGKGFAIYPILKRNLRHRKLRKYKSLRYFRRSRRKAKPWLQQPDLARTLVRLQKQGAQDFYRGRIARLLVREMRRGKGLLRMRDLRMYRAYWRAPLQSSYRGFRVATMGSPSAGGLHMLQLLEILEGFKLSQMPLFGGKRMHLLASAMARVFWDLARFQGDARFFPVPQRALLSAAYIAKLRAQVSRSQGGRFKGKSPDPFAKMHTSHLSVVDRWGNAASVTLTINTWFGSGVIAKGTGILLNNEMDDFTTYPNRANNYGLRQGRGNLILPGKTPLSIMTPTLLLGPSGKLRGVLGSPGGPTILTTVAQLISGLLDHKLGAKKALAMPRIHQQWRPRKIYFESELPASAKAALRKRGHRLKRRRRWGNATLIWVDDKGRLTGGSDPRGAGTTQAAP